MVRANHLGLFLTLPSIQISVQGLSPPLDQDIQVLDYNFFWLPNISQLILFLPGCTPFLIDPLVNHKNPQCLLYKSRMVYITVYNLTDIANSLPVIITDSRKVSPRLLTYWARFCVVFPHVSYAQLTNSMTALQSAGVNLNVSTHRALQIITSN